MLKPETLVDLHCHILPEIDDGSKNLDESLELAKAAVKDGVTHILATPHHLDNKYVNHKVDVEHAVKKFQNELNIRNIPLTIFPSQEIHINGDLIENYDDLLGVDMDKKYVLIEFPHYGVPVYAERILFELQKLGTTPIIVHPERNKAIQGNMDILYKFIRQGALAQLTATSYVGGFGKNVAEISRKLLDHNLVQIVASDAHALTGRNFVLKEALLKLEQDYGSNKALEFEKNAERLVNGEIVKAQGYSMVPKRKKFFFF